MCGALVKMRRCSSANLASGAARKRDSMVDSDAESRKPKMDGVGASGALLPTLTGRVPNKMAEERTTVEMSFMEASTVAQDFNWFAIGAISHFLRGHQLHHIHIFHQVQQQCYNVSYEADDRHFSGRPSQGAR